MTRGQAATAAGSTRSINRPAGRARISPSQSGASIALPRALWDSLGGFDELFVPAYAEDVDLAFRVRAQGLRTVVQPLSQLLHFEGISSGTDLGQGAKAYQVENLRKLHARWATELAGHRDNAVQPELEKERSIQRRASRRPSSMRLSTNSRAKKR